MNRLLPVKEPLSCHDLETTAMTSSDFKKLLDKFAHDVRGPIHTAKLNLEAAQTLAQKNGGPQEERLLKHLALIANELEKLQKQTKDFTAKLK